MSKITSFLFAAVLAGTLSLQAAPTKKEEGLVVRVFATNVSTRVAMPKWGVIGVQGEALPIVLSAFNISPPVRQGDKNAIRLYDFAALEKAIKEEQALPDPVMELPVPSGMERCLVVAKKAKQNDPAGWNCTVYDDSTKAYPRGSCLFLNLTPFKIVGTCGDRKVDMPAQGAFLFDPKIGKEDFGVVVQMSAYYPTGPALFLDQSWVFTPDSRGIILLYESNGTVTRAGVMETVPPDPVPGTPASS